MRARVKILLNDIETSPNLAYVWGKYEQNVIEFETQWYMLSFSARWLGGKHITRGLIDYSGYKKDKENDRKLVTELWGLFNEAEIIIGHNLDNFDIKKSNARFTYHKLTPPAPYKTVDTLKVARKHFAFNSNRLNDLADYLNIGRKIETGGFKLWLGCMSGDKKSWENMKRYNRNDVILLERVYKRLLPWMTSHPYFTDGLTCPKCDSIHIQFRGYTKTITSKFKRFQCQSCGGWGRFPIREERVITMRNI